MRFYIERGDKRNFAAVVIDAAEAQNDIVVEALGKHCLCQRGIVGGSITTSVTDFQTESALREHLQSHGLLVQA